jgi:hypothetical protein
MSNIIIIKYIVEGCRMYKVPTITIIPSGDINIKISFPGVEDININFLGNNSNLVIYQKATEPYPYFYLYANDKIIGKKSGYFNNGTIIVNTFGNPCVYEETHTMEYDG